MRYWRRLTVIVLFAWPSYAQETNAPRLVTGQAVRSGASLPVHSIKPRAHPHANRFRTLPIRPLNKKSKKTARPSAGKFDPAVQTLIGPLSMPAPATSFAGLSNSNNVDFSGTDEIVPPDPNGDVGPNHYVQMVNLLLRVFDKSGTPLTAPLALSDLFTGFGGPCEIMDFASDPIVLYDPLADRWLITQLAAEVDEFFGIPLPPFHECIACSQSGDPTGAYYLYDFVMPNDWVNDYPKFGVWPDAYYMTDNQYDISTDPETPHGAGVFAFDRVKMLAGDPNASFIFFDLEPMDDAIDGLLPADVDGPPPPAGTPNYMACLSALDFGDPQGDALRIFEFHADFADPSNATFIERSDSPVGVAAFDPEFSCGSTLRDCIHQPPPANADSKLDALSDRLMHRLQYRNFGSNESLVANHTVDVGGNHAGVRYYQLRRDLPGGSFLVNEQASYAPDSAHRWMGSVAMDRAGNLAIGYSVSHTNVFPSIRYAGRLAGDPTNGLFQGEATLQAGGGAQTDASSRWGDYSMMAVDPADDCTFWFTSEYYPASSLRMWQTRIGAFTFPDCTPSPEGTLDGIVTETPSGLPIANATVQTHNGFSRQTDGTGAYSMTLPPGTYDLTASALNHRLVTASGVVISNGGTTTQNFSLELAPVMVFVSSNAKDTAGNNNGGIDPNECINLNVVLQNTGAITASNIVAILSTTTAGVSITQPVSAYPNAAVGVSRTNSTPFQFSTAPSFVCGAPIKLLLTVTHNGGTNTIPLHLPTGSSVGSAAQFDATDTPVPIDFLVGGSSSVSVTGIVSGIVRVTASLYMISDANEDLNIYLVGPDNTTVALVLANPSGAGYGTNCSPDAARTTFDDGAGTSIYGGTPPFAGSYQPEEMLSAFNGKSGSAVNGTWTLLVGNFLATADLQCWSLSISPPSCTSGSGGCAVADTDADGLPDWWEQLYFANPTAAVSGQDSDGDGFTNLQEFSAATDPTTAASALRITNVQRIAADVQVSFTSVNTKLYSVQRKDDLTDPTWIVFTNNVAGTGGIVQVIDPGAGSLSKRFYRARLLP